MLCLDERSLALNLHPPRRCVLVSDWLHLVHSIGPWELCFFFHLYTCDPHATSYASRLDLYGDCKYACMLKYVPVSLASWRSLPKMPLFVTVLLVCFSSFLKAYFEVGEFSNVFWFVWGNVSYLRPCAEAPGWWVRILKCDVRCGFSVHHCSCRFVCCFIVFHIRVRLNFPYVCIQVFWVSFF